MDQNKENKVKREFKLSSLSVDNRTTIYVLTFIIFLMGIISYISMPKESFPEIVIPTIYVGTPYPGNSPVDMENLVTRPIEKELKSISGVNKIKSTSIQDYSTIIVEFNIDEDPSIALREVKDAVDKAKQELPNDLPNDPNVFELDFSEFPIMNINLSGDFSLDKLNEYAEFLEDEIEQISEISKVEIKGAPDKEVKIDVDLYKMEASMINFGDIENAIKSENVTLSGGNLLMNNFRRTIRVDGEFDKIEDLGNIIVKDENQNIVFLKDISDISYGYVDRVSYARSYKQPVISLDVVKKSGSNILNAAKKIKNILNKAKKDRFPEELKFSIINDQSRMTKMQVNNLENSIISGMILVVLVLLFFMGLRNALFVGVAIPLSMFMAFMILNAFGVTLNLMVLFALILALGMLVDNGIVVVENIYRLMEEGYSPMRAAKEGVGEVAWPIITSTATTLAAFIPLAFWNDMIGEFMKFLPITLIIVLSSSLFVALIINPVLTSAFMKVESNTGKGRRKIIFIALSLFLLAAVSYFADFFSFGTLLLIFGTITLINFFIFTPVAGWFQTKVLTSLEAVYKRSLIFALKGMKGYSPYFFLSVTVLTLIGSVGLLIIRSPNVNFFPVNEPNYINIFVEMPIGTDIEATNHVTKKIESEVIQTVQPYDYMIESVISNVGEGTSDPSEGPSQGVTPHKAKITVAFEEFEYRKGVSTSSILELIRNEMKDFPGVKITVEKNRMGPPVGKPVNLEVSGEDYEKLIALTADIKQYLEQENIPGIERLKTDLELGKPELLVNVDRERSRRFGISTYQIASGLRTALFGKEISQYKLGEEEYPIQLRLKKDQRYDINTLLNQRITFRDKRGKLRQVPVSAVADIQYSSTYGSVKRKDLDRVISIFSNVKEGYNATEIVNTMKSKLAGYSLPAGYQIKFTGEQEKQAESQAFLIMALMIAVFGILLIMVTQFNSLITPFIIIASVIFSTIGVFLGLVVFNMDFIVIMTGIGIISLAGVVVNNAIVLIDYINLVRKRRRKELGLNDNEPLPDEEVIKSIIEGGRVRLRPVLLTAITTVLGLLPLATGMNINFFTLLSDLDPQIYFGGDNATFWGPMAWTVIFGLTFATFLTLIIVPVMYLIKERVLNLVQKVSG